MFRCWHLILFFSGWAACVALVCRFAHDISFQSTLLNIFGTVLGFVISYRTSSSFERYVRGGCWGLYESLIVLACVETERGTQAVE